MTLGENVRLRRIQLGMTQEELAKKMGYSSRVSVNKIEKGRNVSQKIIVKLATALNCEPAELLFDMITVDEIAEEQAKILDSIESYDLIRAGLAGYFDEEFSDKEIGKLIRYAKLIIEEREP